MIGILGTEAPVKALKLNLIVANSNNTDSNVPELFDNAQIDAYIQYCRAVGAEPMMEVPVDGNNVDAGPTSAQGAADMVTYVNVTKATGSSTGPSAMKLTTMLPTLQGRESPEHHN